MDLTDSKEAGEHVDSKNIKKHKKTEYKSKDRNTMGREYEK